MPPLKRSLEVVCIVWFAVGVGLAGCVPTDSGGPQAWIDLPLDGAYIPLGSEIQVVSHAFVPGGVAEFLLAVDGVAYRRDPADEPGEEFTQASQAWRPAAAARHLLEVVAYGLDGTASAPDSVWVTVTGMATTAPPPADTLPPESTAPPTIPPTPYIIFSADRTSLVEGDCTTLRWRAENALSATLNGASVALTGTQSVCPTLTTTYLLQVVADAGPVTEEVTVSVSAPADTTRPTIHSVGASTGTIYRPNCTPHTVTISASVSDNVGVTQAEVVYRVSGGSWQTRAMGGSGGTYQATLDWIALQASRDPVPTTAGSTLEYFVRVRDAAGNSAESGVGGVAIAGCLI
jgi:hypothetical protein